MAEINTRDLRAFALKGAEQRLVEIAAEAAAIHRAFPELRERSGESPEGRGTQKRAGAAAGPRARGTRRTMSAAARRAVSERMQRYWAARREASASAQAGPAGAQAERGESSPGEARTGKGGRTATSRRGRAKPRRTGAAARKGGTKAR